MLYAIVALLVIIADQLVKYWVSTHIFMETAGQTVIPGILSLVNVHNDGCALSLLSGGGARIYFIVLTGVFTVAVIIALATHFISTPVARWSIVLVTAGGLSNCIDRVISGYVQDMFKLELFNFPIFNVADIFITVFCIVFALAIIFEKDRSDKYDDEFEEEDNEEEDRPKRKSRKKDNDMAAAENDVREKHPKGKKKSADQYEQYKAARAARQQPAQKPAPQRSAVYDAADPFAEWEKANAKVEAQHKNSYAAKAAGINPGQPRYSAPAAAPRPNTATAPRKPAPQPGRPSQPPVRRPAAPQGGFEDMHRRPAAAPAPAPQPRRSAPQVPPEAPVSRPVPPPAAPPAPAAKSADSGLDFSLDDILNEFK